MVSYCNKRTVAGVALALGLAIGTVAILLGCPTSPVDVGVPTALDAGSDATLLAPATLAPPHPVFGSAASYAYPVGPAGGCLAGTYPSPYLDASCIPAAAVTWYGDSGGAAGGIGFTTDAGTVEYAAFYGNQIGQFPTLGSNSVTFGGPHVTAFTSTGGTTYTPTYTGFALGCGCGGGGGGGGGSTHGGGSGGGGGGSLWSCNFFATTLGSGITITPGTGGSGGAGSTIVGGNGTGGTDSTIGALVSFAGASGGGGGTASAFGAGGQAVLFTETPTNVYASTGNAPSPASGQFLCSACGGWGGTALNGVAGATNPTRASGSSPGAGGVGTGTAAGGGGGGEGANGSGGGGANGPAGDASAEGGAPAANTCAGGGGGSAADGAGGAGANGGTGGSGYVLIFD